MAKRGASYGTMEQKIKLLRDRIGLYTNKDGGFQMRLTFFYFYSFPYSDLAYLFVKINLKNHHLGIDRKCKERNINRNQTEKKERRLNMYGVK